MASFVTDTVTRASPDAPLRVFTLGIGRSVSTATVERVAQAGNGESLFADDNEAIVGKLVKLLRAGRSPFIEDVSVDWGVPQGVQNPSPVQSSATFFDPVQPPSVQQSPRQIRRIFPH